MKNTARILCTLAVALVGAAFASTADQELHLRGEVISVSATQLVVKARNGGLTTIVLPEKVDVLDVSKTNIDAVSDNSYIGVAAAPAGPGMVKALGLLVFPEGARGLNEGLFPWDLKKNSTMTNATVAKVAKKGDGAKIQVRYGDRTQTVLVDPTTTVGQIVPGERSMIVVGAKVFLIAVGPAPTAHLVMVGRDGFLPPF
jgi:hypothetical protein